MPLRSFYLKGRKDPSYIKVFIRIGTIVSKSSRSQKCVEVDNRSSWLTKSANQIIVSNGSQSFLRQLFFETSKKCKPTSFAPTQLDEERNFSRDIILLLIDKTSPAGPELSHKGWLSQLLTFYHQGWIVEPKFSTKLSREMDYNLYVVSEMESSLCFNKCLLGRVPIKVSNNQSMKILLVLRIAHFVQNLFKSSYARACSIPFQIK